MCVCVFKLTAGQYVCPANHGGSPQVEVEVIGIPVDCAKHKSKVIARNALNPIWNEVYTFQVGPVGYLSYPTLWH